MRPTGWSTQPGEALAPPVPPARARSPNSRPAVGSTAVVTPRRQLALERHVRHSDAETPLRSGPAVMHRLLDVIDVKAVRPERSQ